MWKDERLLYSGRKHIEGWNSSKNSLNLPISKEEFPIWKPQILPSNGVMSNASEEMSAIFQPNIFDDLFLKAKGWNVLWERLMTIQVLCIVFQEDFPFDLQACQIMLVPWQNVESNFYEFSLRAIDTSDAMRSCAGSKTVIKPTAFTIPCDGIKIKTGSGPNPYVSYDFQLERKSQFYIINYVWPLIVIVLSMYVTIWLPHLWYDKVTTVVTLILTVFLIFTLSNTDTIFGFDTWSNHYFALLIVFTLIPPLEPIFMNVYARNQRESAKDKERGHIWGNYYIMKKFLIDKELDQYVFKYQFKSHPDVPKSKITTLRDDVSSNGTCHGYDYEEIPSYMRCLIDSFKMTFEMTFKTDRLLDNVPELKGRNSLPWLVKDGSGATTPFLNSTVKLSDSVRENIYEVNLSEPLQNERESTIKLQEELQFLAIQTLVGLFMMVSYPGACFCAIVASLGSINSKEVMMNLIAGNSAVLIYSTLVMMCLVHLLVLALFHVVELVGQYAVEPVIEEEEND